MGEIIYIMAWVAIVMAGIEVIKLAVVLARILLLGVEHSFASHFLTHASVHFRLKLG
jgi:hypothetical protein